MASSPDSSPSGNNSSSSSPPPPSGDNSSPPPSSPPPSKSPPPSSPPPSSPPPKSESPPPPDSKSPPPSGGKSPPPSGKSPSPPAAALSPPAPTTPEVPLVFSPPSPIPRDDPALTPPNAPSHRSPSNGPSRHKSSSDDSTEAITGLLGSVIVLAVMIIACAVCCRKKKRRSYPSKGSQIEYYQGRQQWNVPQDHVVKLQAPPNAGGWGAPQSSEHSSNFSGSHQTPQGQHPTNMSLGYNQSQFSIEDLASATGGFSDANLIGQGGFGFVHKGVLPNGQEVAVKSLKTGSGQGEREFQAEVEIISRVHHRHLVSLVGYSIADTQRMLVYEFVPNNTLEYHLYNKENVMDWPTRLRIAVGSAKGLAYLHEDCHPKIIHRDIKAANILLDNNYEAMVADFGLAKLSSDNFTHVSTRVMGTFGYLAPEYAQSGKLTDKSDVFSFGVMLLELITGRKPFDPMSKYSDDGLVDWARPLMTKALDDGNYSELVDPRLENNYNPQEMARMVALAAASVRHSARRRPKMSQIVRTLEGDSSLDDLSDAGSKASSGLTASQVYDTGAYNADMLKFRKMVLDSGEYTSD
ncbi:Proline-rich receptor-like protein kinase PERK5 [Heracleum sosnowskyi]|uniref:non-specific serine/threonine protein kinase n=1 Tax=Heracleum sosnowskyi TaxID=360622 RepID=A0AAD8H0R8_9APIA|nr:Proline-rich receptor-like protein kinase PERK5 [Heracleum sosnowskyi]